MKFRARRVEEPEVNLISFIDVVLMIVIFFMLSSTFSQEGRLKIRLPGAGIAAVPRTATPPIILAVSVDGVYQLNGTMVDGTDSTALRAALVAVAGEARDARITVRADAQATHQAVVTAMDVIARLGFREVDIATLQEGSGSGGAEAAAARTGAAPK
jgi:biopolymer transport protein ExbD